MLPKQKFYKLIAPHKPNCTHLASTLVFLFFSQRIGQILHATILTFFRVIRLKKKTSIKN